MRVHFWTADNGGSAMYRGHLPALGLSWLGHRPSVGTVLPSEEDGTPKLDGLDVVVGCRVAKAGPLKMWQQLKDRGVRLVYDLDDDYLHTDPAYSEAHKLWTSEPMRDGLLEAISLADTVTVCSRRLVEVFGEHHDDVRLIPNGLPAQYLARPREYRPQELVVGWAGSSATYLELPLAARHIRRITEYRDSPVPVVAHMIGIGPQDAVKAGVTGESCYATGFLRDFRQYLEAVSRFDIWVAPYRDIPFNRAKFATKALEAGFLGIPLIASAIEPYADAVVHGETGLLVPPGQEHLFGRYLKQLTDEPETRQRMGLAARAKASGSILQSLNKQWEEVLKG